MQVLIVDDEPLAREGLRLLLQQFNDVSIAGECSNGAEAIQFITTKVVDLVFLDIQMPKVNGFDVIEAVGPEQMPTVVFITAFDEYAVKAFKVNALDYLLKPLDPDQLAISLDRVRNEIDKRNVSERAQLLRALLNSDEPNFQAHNRQRIVVRNAGHVYFIQPSEIIWVEANGDYVTLHANDRDHLLRDTMHNMEKRLSGYGFRRIHRSNIVNLNCIAELIANDSGDYQVVLKDKQILKLSRSYRDELYAALNAD